MRITVVAFLLVLSSQLSAAVRPQRYFEPNRGQSVPDALYSSAGEGFHVSLNHWRFGVDRPRRWRRSRMAFCRVEPFGSLKAPESYYGSQ